MRWTISRRQLDSSGAGSAYNEETKFESTGVITNVTGSCCESGVEYLAAFRAILQRVHMLAVCNTVASWW